MYGLAVAGMMGSAFYITLAECFVFSSLIVAVDPVAVRQLLSFVLLYKCNIARWGTYLFPCDAVYVLLYKMNKSISLQFVNVI